MSARTVGPYRLEQGGLIDRSKPISFSFNGQEFTGFQGDSLASALLANGLRVVARSFKFHRPRGVFSCGLEEPNALMALSDGASATPSVRAPQIELTEGLRAASQAGWPSVNFDIGRALDLVAPLWSAGFYNKTFMWPSWHTYEPIIRRLAGLGRAPSEPDPDRYEVGNMHCDVLVVGGGVAGLQAALEAGQGGARVLLVEQDRQIGGRASWGSREPARSASEVLQNAIGQLGGMRNVRIMVSTVAVGYYDHNVVALHERVENAGPRDPRERYWIVRAGRVVLATGAIEQPLVFSNNDRPGIILAGAARQYLRRYGVAVGHRVLIATNSNAAYAFAEELDEAGVDVLGVADSRSDPPSALIAAMRARSIEVFSAALPVDTQGFTALRSVTLGRLSDDASRIEETCEIECDALAVSGGFAPALQLLAQAGGKLAYDDASGVLQPVTSHPSITIVGTVSERIPVGPRVSPIGASKRKWVDLLHDVTVADLELALRENFTSVEHVKRYTTVGMAADQGKTATAASLEVLGKLRRVASTALGHTTMRPPFAPVTLGAIVGREKGQYFAPRRELPMHDWHVSHGALIQDFGEWRRPVVYRLQGETREAAVRREALNVRTAAGLLDSSSFGKIEIQGPDALEFIDRFYINDLTTLKPNRARYGFMLRETGIILDDGTVVMLSPDRFLITTTTGNSGRVAAWLEEWHQCEWPHLRVAIVPVTEQWGTISLAGPKARIILSALETDIDLSAPSFPHLAMREGQILGLPTRIYRVSFTGEVSYEINVPAKSAQRLWEALIAAGRAHGIQPLGLDALQLLRLEKGFLHVGTDTDGTTVPDDIGWGKVASNKKRDFIGKRSLRLPEHVRSDRYQLVGLSGSAPFAVGSHLRFADSTNPTDGWITSVGTLTLAGGAIALALLRGGRAKVGSRVAVHDDGAKVAEAEVVATPFFDPSGERINA